MVVAESNSIEWRRYEKIQEKIELPIIESSDNCFSCISGILQNFVSSPISLSSGKSLRSDNLEKYSSLILIPAATAFVINEDPSRNAISFFSLILRLLNATDIDLLNIKFYEFHYECDWVKNIWNFKNES